VLEGIGRRLPLVVDLFTTVPEWFFADSLSVRWELHHEPCDIGLVQSDALHEDLAGTVRALDALLPFAAARVAALAALVRARGCQAVLCDVAPLGIAVAQAAGLPAGLIENFTWDWIYAAYLGAEPGLARHADELARWFARAEVHVQTTPACRPLPAAYQVPPVARRPRRSREEVRQQLGLLDGERAVLVTMGGIPWDFAGFTPRPPAGVVLVVPGGASERRRLAQAILLPFHSPLYHPDLVAAADAVVGKLGYSTFAEAWTTGVPYGFIPRDPFPESPVLADFVQGGGAGAEVSPRRLAEEDWGWLEGLLSLARPDGGRPDGSDAAAAALIDGLGLSAG
jgi:hypothetical protein